MTSEVPHCNEHAPERVSFNIWKYREEITGTLMKLCDSHQHDLARIPEVLKKRVHIQESTFELSLYWTLR